MIRNSSTFSGYLVGIGKITKDGAMEHRFLDTPIKNMIVKQGLNNWLRYNGSDTALINVQNLSLTNTYFAFGYPLENIQWCAYGSSNSPSIFANTVELGNRLVNPYTTKKVNWPYCGASRYNTSKIRNRVTHISTASETDVSVNEIGYYLQLTDKTTFQMFSRVVLPSPYELSAGEQLVTTYELVYDVADVAEPTEPFLTGLYDANGLQLEAKKKITFDVSTSTPCIPACPSIYAPDGTAFTSKVPGSSYSLYLPIYYCSSDFNRLNKNGYATSAYNFPAMFANVTNLNYGPASASDKRSPTIVSQPYAYDSFYRDSVWTLPQYWPTLTETTDTISIYFLKLGAVDLQFGHTVDGTWTPTPWLKRGNTTTTITIRHAISTPESIAWQQSQG